MGDERFTWLASRMRFVLGTAHCDVHKSRDGRRLPSVHITQHSVRRRRFITGLALPAPSPPEFLSFGEQGAL